MIFSNGYNYTEYLYERKLELEHEETIRAIEELIYDRDTYEILGKEIDYEQFDLLKDNLDLIEHTKETTYDEDVVVIERYNFRYKNTEIQVIKYIYYSDDCCDEEEYILKQDWD